MTITRDGCAVPEAFAASMTSSKRSSLVTMSRVSTMPLAAPTMRRARMRADAMSRDEVSESSMII